MGFGVWSVGLRVQGLGLRVYSVGFEVWRVVGFRFGVEGVTLYSGA